DLRAYLMIANKGQLRRKSGDELVNQASCLNLITNAVILWNTVYMAEAIAQLKQEGYPVNERDLSHIWPTRYEHINSILKFFSLAIRTVLIFQVLHSIGATHNHGVAFG